MEYRIDKIRQYKAMREDYQGTETGNAIRYIGNYHI